MVNRISAILLASLALVMVSCCAAGPHAAGGRGIAGTPVVGVQHTASMLTRNQPFTTEQLMVLQFSRGGEAHLDFRGVFGPIGAVTGNPNDGIVAEATLRNPAVSLHINTGFIYLVGHRPHTRTPRGSFTGHGTTMIVQTLEDRDRAFLLADAGDRITIRLAGLGPEDLGDDRLQQLWHYVEVFGERDGGFEIGDVLPIPAKGDPIREFVDAAILAARAAGLPTPTEP